MWKCDLSGNDKDAKGLEINPGTNSPVQETDPANDGTKEEEMEKRKCENCNTEFQPRRIDQRYCSKPCRDAGYNEARANGGSGSGRTKRQSRKRGSILPKDPIISDAITLDAKLLRAVKKSAVLDFLKNDLPKIVEELLS